MKVKQTNCSFRIGLQNVAKKIIRYFQAISRLVQIIFFFFKREMCQLCTFKLEFYVLPNVDEKRAGFEIQVNKFHSWKKFCPSQSCLNKTMQSYKR